MKTSYCGKDLYTPAFQELMDKKLEGLNKFLKGESVANVNLSKDGKLFKTSIQIKNKGREFRVVAQNPDMYENINACFDSLKQQIINAKYEKKGRKGIKQFLLKEDTVEK